MLQRKDLTLADARDAIFATKEVLNLYDARYETFFKCQFR